MSLSKNEVEILENYIKDKYRSKAEFCKKIEMTPQNLNYIIRTAVKNENRFTIDFKARVEMLGLQIFESLRKPTNDFISGVNEPNALYGNINERIKNLEIVLEANKEIIATQKQLIVQLEERLAECQSNQITDKSGKRQRSA